ncbi:hypothetical protein N7499_000254 [Penicillium canescens]|uniref:uncharacterized protein n=1 Tax=Penicillium canescens TaxID=5083 RepID=UPI0026E070D6|nr:uncharacterized protein N7446_011546 [Penicillium canescens]KAJ6004184.1 hypothetical protein N7522_005829 [Penicillium canescens]KAJ6048863.1 hypothetical protein N7446_011546 [Penicillium canescens]KAJ6100624.1 hypothetical protein N7499_000254 [Penicillium canescens]KAJ6173085.1 hypothetical protein N7485_005897 [Penicillium canescens]
METTAGPSPSTIAQARMPAVQAELQMVINFSGAKGQTVANSPLSATRVSERDWIAISRNSKG